MPGLTTGQVLPLQASEVTFSLPRPSRCNYLCTAKVLGPHLPGLCDSMLSTALFDREVNVRRAAAAALQASAR